MSVVHGVTRGVTGILNATTAAAGAVSGAAVSGVVGGVRGTAEGVRNGLSSGSHSTPAAALTLAVFGAVGLVEWPVLLVVGGTALAVRRLSESRENGTPTPVASAPRDSLPPPRSAPTKADSVTPVKARAVKARPARQRQRPSR